MIELDIDPNGDARVMVNDLIGQALDFWVCLCLGQKAKDIMALSKPTQYSSDWSMCGPLLFDQRIATAPTPNGMWGAVWIRPENPSKLILPQSVRQGPPKVGAFAADPRIAACRAFVAGIASPQVTLPKHYHEVYIADLEALKAEVEK